MGYYPHHPASYVWDGSQWSEPDNRVFGYRSWVYRVSCAATICMTAGYTPHLEPFTVVYKGRRWRDTSPPPPDPSRYAEAMQVSCRSANSCLMTGSYHSTRNGTNCCPFAYQWNGTRWTSTAAPQDVLDLSSFGDSGNLDCHLANACVEVGQDKRTHLAAIQVRINGAWTDGGAAAALTS
jgi:hypothetical protein